MSRRFLLTIHAGRDEALRASRQVCELILASGDKPVLNREELKTLKNYCGQDWPKKALVLNLDEVDPNTITAGIALGGDGTILRAIGALHNTNSPTFGINMGHVGFLAESDEEDHLEATKHILTGKYYVEKRTTLTVKVYRKTRMIYSGWALNEAAIERAQSGRMMELALAVDRQPVMSFGCNGAIVSTPTGSTAYAFSAGGPIVWPEVEALLLAPIDAHALFSRPMVVAPTSSITVEMLSRNKGFGVLNCDGAEVEKLYPSDHVVFRQSKTPALLGILNRLPFSERLVQKFNLPRHGWRGPIEGG